MVTLRFVLLFGGKLLLNQGQRRLQTSEFSKFYLSAASRMISGPAKGLGWRSHLSETLFQLVGKLWQNFMQEKFPFCLPFPTGMTVYQFFWVHLLNTIQRAKRFTLHCEVCNPLLLQHTKCCRKYQGRKHGVHLMVGITTCHKNIAVLLLESCQDTQTSTLQSSVGIQPNKYRGTLSRREERTLCVQQTNSQSH